MKTLAKTALLAAGAICLAYRTAAQPAGAKPIPTPNGEVWMVDERWFEKDPPFLEFYKYGEQDGLKIEASANLLLQDGRGDIWLKDDGADPLIRFDGHEFKYYRTVPSDTAQLINGIFSMIVGMVESSDGGLWVLHELGFSRYDPLTERFSHFRVQVDSCREIPAVFFKGRKAPSGFFDPVTQRFVKAFRTNVIDATKPERKIETTCHWLLHRGWMDKKGQIWSFQHTPVGRGLVCVRPSEGTTLLYPMIKTHTQDKAAIPDYDPWITDFEPDQTGENIWVAGWRSSLRCFNMPSEKWIQYAQNYKTDEGKMPMRLEVSMFVTPDPDGRRLWIGPSGGLGLFDPNTKKFSAWWRTDEPGSVAPTSHNLTNLLFDKDGRLWYSIGGLMVHDEKRHFIEKTGIRLPKGRIREALYDPQSNATWFLKEDTHKENTGGIYRLDETTGKVDAFAWPIFFDEKTGFRQLNGMAMGGDDLYFVSSYSLYHFNLKSQKLKEIVIPLPPELVNKQRTFINVRDVAVSTDGTCWISINNQATDIPLVHYFPAENRFEYIRNHPEGLTIKGGGSLFIDCKKRVWLMSDHTDRKGVNCYDPKSKKVLVFRHDPLDPATISNDMVTNMAEDEQGRIWMATYSGICWYDPSGDKIQRAVHLPFWSRFITIDKSGNIWVSGDGTACYNLRTKTLRQFGAANGMYWKGEPLYTRSDGAVCFGPYYRIHPDSIPRLELGPVCRFTDFRVFDRKLETPLAIDFMEKIELPHTDNTFAIAWSARNFTNPEQDTFYHRLEGVDDDWVATPASQRSTSYLKLPPGDYRFRLKCKNRDGVFGPEKTLLVRIIPAFWQTWWFRLLVISALAGVVAVIASLRQRQKRLAAELKQREAEFKQKEAEMNQSIAEYQVAALRSQMNPHFIFNSLNSINRFVQLSGPDDASNYLTKFARLIRLVLDNSRAEVISLESELEAIRLYLELESLRFAGQFEYRVSVAQDVDIEEISVPPLFVQPYVENAVWHGLMQKAEADRQLEIHVRLDERGWLCIEISDNGIGRERAKELKSKSATRQKSHGMDITAERVRMFTERTGRQMVVQVDDLFAEGGEPCGTRVKIMLETGASNQNLP